MGNCLRRRAGHCVHAGDHAFRKCADFSEERLPDRGFPAAVPEDLDGVAETAPVTVEAKMTLTPDRSFEVPNAVKGRLLENGGTEDEQ